MPIAVTIITIKLFSQLHFSTFLSPFCRCRQLFNDHLFYTRHPWLVSKESSLFNYSDGTREFTLHLFRDIHVFWCWTSYIVLKLCQPGEIVIIQVRRNKVLSECRLERKRQSDQRKQEVKGVKPVERNAQRSKKGRWDRQNTARETRKRTRKGISKKANIQRRAT